MASHPHAHCVCAGDGNPHALCLGSNGFQENEIRAHLLPLRGERVEAIAFDGCIATDQNSLRCDGLLVLLRRGQTDLLLVELKNTRNAEHGYQQIYHTAHHRADYQAIRHHEERNTPGRLSHQGFLITTKLITTLERSRAERRSNGFMVNVIHVQRGSSVMLNLRYQIS